MENPILSQIGKPSRTIRGKMRNVDRAYLAGFFDGEGSVGLYWNRCSSKQTGKIRNDWKPSFFSRVMLGNTDSSIPKLLREWYGGSLLQEKKQVNLPVWRWSATGKVADHFLRDIVPYLTQKKERAKMLIRYYQQRKKLSFEEKCELRMKFVALNGISGKSHYPQRLNEETLHKGVK